MSCFALILHVKIEHIEEGEDYHYTRAVNVGGKQPFSREERPARILQNEVHYSSLRKSGALFSRKAPCTEDSTLLEFR
jgi:hypothetical protein